MSALTPKGVAEMSWVTGGTKIASAHQAPDSNAQPRGNHGGQWARVDTPGRPSLRRSAGVRTSLDTAWSSWPAQVCQEEKKPGSPVAPLDPGSQG